MMYMKKNPYVWSDSSRDVTSPVMAVSLNSGNNTAVNVDNLDEPVAISLTNFGKGSLKSGNNMPVNVDNLDKPSH